MGNRSYYQYFISGAIAKLVVGIIVLWQPKLTAQVRPTELPPSFPSGFGSSWENAVMLHKLNSRAKIQSVKFSPDGKILAAVENNQIVLWDAIEGKIRLSFSTHRAKKQGLNIAPTAIAFSPDSRWLATATWGQGFLTPDSGVVVWDTTTGEAIVNLEKGNGCRQLAFDETGEILYAACNTGITAWNLANRQKLFSFPLKNPIEAIALHNGDLSSNEERIMATVNANPTEASSNHQIDIWQIEDKKASLINTLDGHVNPVARLEFTADGKRLVSSSYDGKIKVWNWQEGTTDRQTNSLHSDRGLFSLSANSRLIAGNFYSSTMTDLATGLPLRNVMIPQKKDDIKLVAFSPQGKLFARVRQSPDSKDSEIQIFTQSPE